LIHVSVYVYTGAIGQLDPDPSEDNLANTTAIEKSAKLSKEKSSMATDAVNHAGLSPALCLAASKHSLARNTLD
jgi:hypothetical protein